MQQTGKATAAATLLLLLWTLAGLTPALAQDHCDAAGIVLGDREPHTFPNKDGMRSPEMTLFMRPESNSTGFTVHVLASDGTEHTASFPAEKQCFPDTDTWYQLLVFAEIKIENSTIEFGFETQHCQCTCERHSAPQDLPLQNMSVVAHGAGRWSTTDFLFTGCHFESLSTGPEHHKLPVCNKPPIFNKPQPGPHPGVAAGITIAVVAAIAALVGGAVWLIKKRNGLSWATHS